jgi:hypothetical protein
VSARLVGIALCAACAAVAVPSGGDGTGPGQPAPAVQLIPTPMSTPTWIRGKCLIFDLRRGALPVAWDDSICDGGASPDARYRSWLPDFWVQALRFAEQIACGTENCALKGGSARVYLSSENQVPTLDITRSDTQWSIRVNTALIDLVESSAITYLDEGRGRPNLWYRAWLSKIDAMGGGGCTRDIPNGFHQLSDADFILVRKFAQVFYSFIFAHEVAHAIKGDACGGSPGDILAQEQACDNYAFGWMGQRSFRSDLPSAFIPPVISFAHYIAFRDPELTAQVPGSDPGLSFVQNFAGAEWMRRAEALLSTWERHCAADPADDVACRAGWRSLLDDARRLEQRPLPRACVPGASVSTATTSASSPPMGTSCYGYADGGPWLSCSKTPGECASDRASFLTESPGEKMTPCHDVSAMFCGSRRWNANGRVTAYCSSSAAECAGQRRRYEDKGSTSEVFGCTFFARP